MEAHFGKPIKQHPGPIQVTRRVKVVPGKHFPQLQPAEQALFYPGTAVEFRERHSFQRHVKAWGAAHTGPGVRFICDSDALDDPDNRGYWTTLALWNRWRHDTFKDNPDGELQYLDELPASPTVAAAKGAKGAKAEKEAPAMKSHFEIVGTQEHTIGGAGSMAGRKTTQTLFACKMVGCLRGASKPIPEIGTGTGQLFRHLKTCQPELCKRLRASSAHSPVVVDPETGEEYAIMSFDELLPHHVLYVQKCFRGLDHFYETRADNGLLEYIRSFERRANLPHANTCEQLLETMEELVDEKIAALIARHKHAVGEPCAGSTTDIWSLESCRESFGCLRCSFVMDGDMVAQVTGEDLYKGTLVDMAPILAFSRFAESRHTVAVVAAWKQSELKIWRLEKGIGLATEDGAAPNKKANRILGQDMKVCVDHDIARAVLLASGEDGTPSRNPELKALIARSSKQAGSFHRSVVASKALQQAQLDADPDLYESQTLTTKTKNKTRWLSLHTMCNRNRRIGVQIRTALTGDEGGECAEMPADTEALSGSESGGESDGEDQEAANRVANKKFPLAHRCLSLNEFRYTDVLESLLDRPRETTLLVQDETEGFGEGLDIGLAWLALKAMHDEANHPRIELVSSTSKLGDWKETNATSLKPMFKTFRKEFVSELTTRFTLDSTPDAHTLLALAINPSINTTSASPLLKDKTAMYEMLVSAYKRALRRQAVRLNAHPASQPAQAEGVHAGGATADGATEAATEAPAPTPVRKRKSLLGSVAQVASRLGCGAAAVCGRS